MMTRVVLWIAVGLLFVSGAIAALNFVGTGTGFPVIFLFVAALFAGVVAYPLWQRQERDEAGHRESVDPSIPPTQQPDYRGPWDGLLPP